MLQKGILADNSGQHCRQSHYGHYGAKAGVAYIIECGSTENATTIAKSDKFADITEAYTPTKEGDYIMVILNSKGELPELERQVGGVRVNAALQPNIPESDNCLSIRTDCFQIARGSST